MNILRERQSAHELKRWAYGIMTASIVVAPLSGQRALSAPQGPPVQVTVNGRTWTQQELFQRNIGAPEDQATQFPPHKIIGNIYDVPLASHPAMYNLADKYPRLAAGGPNPFIDPAGYKAELDLVEAMFVAVLEAQRIQVLQ